MSPKRKRSPIRKLLSPKNIIIPIVLGLGVVGFLIYSTLTQTRFEEAPESKGNYVWVDTNENQTVDKTDASEFIKVENGQGNYNKITYEKILSSVNWSWYSTLWIFMAVLMMVVRDVAYMYRIRILTDEQINWRRSFDTIMLWEFASAITPSVVGGSGVAIVIVNREGVNLGKSTAVVMVTALMDELFYLTMVPFILFFVGTANLFPVELEKNLLGITLNTQGIFVIGYLFIFLLTSIITYAIFFRPRGFKYLLLKIFRWNFLRKWRFQAARTGDEIMITSRELRDKNWKFWFKSMVATYFSWTARYMVVNFLILAFIPVSQHLLIYARQLVMWVIMLISPTPGSSGVAEVAFSGFLLEFIPTGLESALALLWRLISYYPYLVIGAIILPGWITRVYLKRRLVSFKKT